MIIGRDERQFPLIRDITDDRYIFYMGKKAKSKFDIEALMRDKPNYKVLLLVDQKDTIELLCKRIGDTMERFPAFSGIPRLSAKNLHILSEEILIKAPYEGVVGDYVKYGDKIIFDLEYQEFWIEVELSLYSLNKHLKIELSLKVDKNKKLENLKQDLASISICLWNHFVKKQQDFHIYEYYLLIEFNLIESFNFSNDYSNLLVKDRYDFDSKIKCNCEFININQYILNTLAQHIRLNNLQKSKLVSEYLGKLMLSKNDKYLDYVIWKKDKLEYDDESSDYFRKSGGSKENLIYEDEVESQYNPRISTTISLNKQNSELNINIFRSCYNYKSKYLSESSSRFVVSHTKFQENEIEKMNDIFKNFILNELIKEKAGITVFYKNKDNTFRITKFMDMTGMNKTKDKSFKNFYFQQDFRRLSERKEILENIRKKRMYVIIMVIFFFVFFYTFIVR